MTTPSYTLYLEQWECLECHTTRAYGAQGAPEVKYPGPTHTNGALLTCVPCGKGTWHLFTGKFRQRPWKDFGHTFARYHEQ